LARNRADINDRAAHRHARDKGAATIEDPARIHANHGVPVFIRAVGDGFLDLHARIVDEDIQRSDCLCQGVDLLGIGDIDSRKKASTIPRPIP